MPKNIVGGINQCFRNISAWKVFLQKKEISLFSVGTFFPTVPKTFVNGILQCVRKIRAWKNFMQKEGVSLFSVGTFFSHSADKFRGRN